MFDDKEQEKEITTVLFRLFLFLFFLFGSSSLLINIKNILTISQLIYIFFFD